MRTDIAEIQQELREAEEALTAAYRRVAYLQMLADGLNGLAVMEIESRHADVNAG